MKLCIFLVFYNENTVMRKCEYGVFQITNAKNSVKSRVEDVFSHYKQVKLRKDMQQSVYLKLILSGERIIIAPKYLRRTVFLLFLEFFRFASWQYKQYTPSQ